mmetsp:Transcript_68011/g.219801  ORF Transcript_68011/g.219801 Transcript_68011/m.219801 type:complete len:300 (-) Transcript_68011:908-1807(-)
MCSTASAALWAPPLKRAFIDRARLAATANSFFVITVRMSSLRPSAVKLWRKRVETSFSSLICSAVAWGRAMSTLTGSWPTTLAKPRRSMSSALEFWSANMGKATTGVAETMASEVAPQPQWLRKATTFLCCRTSACGSQLETRKSSPRAWLPPAGSSSCWAARSDHRTRHSPGALRPSHTFASCSAENVATEPMDTYTTGPGRSRKSCRCLGSALALASSAMMPTGKTFLGSATSWLMMPCKSMLPTSAPKGSSVPTTLIMASIGMSCGALKQCSKVGPQPSKMNAPRIVAGADVINGT